MFATLGMNLERHRIEQMAKPDPGTEIADLVREVQSGRSATAFQRLFERYAVPVENFFLNRGFSPQESEDLTQETFFRVYRSIGAFRSDASFATWLFSIVKNVWKNELRKRYALKREADEVPLEALIREDGDEAVFTEPPDPEQGPLDQVLAGERERLLYRALDELPPKMRECALMRIAQDLKYREIAALLKVSIATVKSQLNAVKQRLGPLLEPHSDVLS
jgi:RNA polymerase sigma-70 factor, ECF subfamily